MVNKNTSCPCRNLKACKYKRYMTPNCTAPIAASQASVARLSEPGRSQGKNTKKVSPSRVTATAGEETSASPCFIKPGESAHKIDTHKSIHISRQLRRPRRAGATGKYTARPLPSAPPFAIKPALDNPSPILR